MSFSSQQVQISKEAYTMNTLKNYDFPSSLKVKLIQQNSWTPEFTERVLKEYLRFIHLAIISDEEVTPSQIVDTAWHMHLTFTRDYWERMVPMLPRVLHHNPCEGKAPLAEKLRYGRQYQETLYLYNREFNESPPNDIWGGVESKEQITHQKSSKIFGILGRIFFFLLIVITAGWFFGLTGFAIGLIVAPIIILAIDGKFSRRNRENSNSSSSSSGGDSGDSGSDSGGCGGGGGCGG